MKKNVKVICFTIAVLSMHASHSVARGGGGSASARPMSAPSQSATHSRPQPMQRPQSAPQAQQSRQMKPAAQTPVVAPQIQSKTPQLASQPQVAQQKNAQPNQQSKKNRPNNPQTSIHANNAQDVKNQIHTQIQNNQFNVPMSGRTSKGDKVQRLDKFFGPNNLPIYVFFNDGLSYPVSFDQGYPYCLNDGDWRICNDDFCNHWSWWEDPDYVICPNNP